MVSIMILVRFFSFTLESVKNYVQRDFDGVTDLADCSAVFIEYLTTFLRERYCVHDLDRSFVFTLY